MFSVLDVIIFGAGLVVIVLLCVASRSLAYVIDSFPVKNNLKFPKWSSPIAATTIFAVAILSMYLIGGVIVYLSTDKYGLIVGIVMMVAALLTAFNMAGVSMVSLKALSLKQKEG